MSVAAAELVLGLEPDAVPRARRLVSQSLADAPGSLPHDAELVAAELVTNALLHGAAPVVLRLERYSDRVRIQVTDQGRHLPVRIQSSTESMTGRGLGLVAALARRWGIDPAGSGGKAVWVELGLGDRSTTLAPDPDVDVDALLASWADEERLLEQLFTVELGAVPTDLLIDAKAHIDNLVREFTLASSGALGQAADPLPPHLAGLVQTVVHGFGTARAQIKEQAAAAAATGAAETSLRVRLPLSAADAGERYLAALDQADEYARAARLLTLETPPLHRVFRRWYVQGIVDQLREAAAGRPPAPIPTFPQRLAEEVSSLAPLRRLTRRLAALQKVTAELTGAADVEAVARTVVTNAVEVLGAQAARLYLLEGDVLRYAAGHGGEPPSPGERDLPLEADLPAAVAARTGTLVHVRDYPELTSRFPSLAGVYGEEHSLMCAPLALAGHRLGVLALTYRERSPIGEETQLAFLTTLADVTAQALERATATSLAVAAHERLAFLAEASVLLSSTLDYRSVLEAIAKLVVPRLADWCVIQLVEGHELVTVALTHADPGRAAWARRLAERYPTDMDAPTGAPQVVRTGRSELYATIPREMLEAAAIDPEHLRALEELGISSGLVVPLAGRTGVVGALSMIYAESGRRYDESDVAFAADLARRAALAVETAQAFREQSGLLATVTRVAEAAQHAILAPPPPQLGPVALAARYVSAATEALIGGDLYEVVERPGAVRLLIGDVRGKGLEAVRTATVVLGEFRAAAVGIDGLLDVAAQIDARVRPYLDDEDFVTALVAEVNDDGTFALASCGHPPAIVAADGQVREVACPPSPPLGLGAAPTLVTGRLTPGARMLLYTDGVIEARDAQGSFVDLAELTKALADGTPQEALDRMLEALRAAVGGALGDDLALLVAEYRGPSTDPA